MRMTRAEQSHRWRAANPELARAANQRSEAVRMARYYERRGAFFAANPVCVWCGSRENLQMDHIDETLKTFAFTQAGKVSDARWLREIENAQSLCVGCHGRKSAATARPWLVGVPA